MPASDLNLLSPSILISSMNPSISRLVIIGAGGFAKELAWLWQTCKKHDPDTPDLIGFIDGSPEWKDWQGIPVLGGDDWAAKNLDADTGYILGIGQAKIRQRLAQYYDTRGLPTTSLIHPKVRMGPGTELSEGVTICAGNTLTVDIKVGRHVLINLHGTIGHDTVIGDYSVLSPGVHVSGHSNIGQTCDLGTGVMILPDIKIPAETVIGAGAVVTRNIDQPGTYIGVPAKKWL